MRPTLPVVAAFLLLASAGAEGALTRPSPGTGGNPLGMLRLPGADATNRPAVLWRHDLESALAEAQAEYRTVLVLATTPDCGYCRRLKSVVLPDPEVQALLAKFVTVEIDVEANEELGAQLRVRGVPTLVFLSSSGAEIGRIAGMVAKEALVEALAAVSGSEAAPVRTADDDALLELLEAPAAHRTADQWTALVAGLGRNGVREEIRAGLRAAPPPRPTLAALLEHPRLAVRLGAIETLEELAGEDYGYDPWADADGRAEAIRRWQAWAASTSAPARAAFSALREDEVENALREAVSSDRDQGQRAARLLARGGREILPALDRFASNRPGLDAMARRRLTEIRYTVLIPRVRIGPAPDEIARRLVAGNPDLQLETLRGLGRHGRAALPVLEDFLAAPDPMLREAAVETVAAALGPDAVPRLEAFAATEKDTDVLVAVIRALALAGKDDAAPALAKFLDGRDEDLVVLALQSLSKLSASAGLEKPLQACLADPRWRVRAAALDVVAQGSIDALAPEAEKALEDPETFVRYKAVEAVSALQKEKARPRLEKLFLSDDDLKAPVLAALSSMGGTPSPAVLASLEGTRPETLLGLLQVMGESRGESMLALVLKLSAHPNLDVSCAAWRILASHAYRKPAYAQYASKALADGPREKQLAILRNLTAAADETMTSARSWVWMATDRAIAGLEALPGTDRAADAAGLLKLFAAFGAVSGQGQTEPAAVAPTNALPLVAQVTGLHDGTRDPELRFAAGLALLRLGQTNALPGLAAGFDGLTSDERREVIAATERWATPEALALQIRALRDARREVREAAVEAMTSRLSTPDVADAFFAEVARTNSPLHPADLVTWGLSSQLRQPASRRTVETWAARFLDPATPRPRRVLGALLAAETGQKSALSNLVAMAADADPWIRRAGVYAIGRIDPAQLAGFADRIATDTAEPVREIVPAIFGKSTGSWLHRFDDERTASIYSYVTGDRSAQARLAATERSNVVAALSGMLAGDPSPRLRVDAGLALLVMGAPSDARAIVAAAQALPDPRAVGERIGSVLEDRYKRLGPEYAPLAEYLAHARINPAEKQKILAHFGLAAKPAAAAAPVAALRAAPAAVAPAGDAAPEPAPAGPATVRLVYFHEHGCPDCAQVKAYLAALEQSFPELKVESHEIGSPAARELNRRLGETFEVDPARRLVVPAVFAGGGYLIRTDIAFERLADLVVRSAGVPDADWYPAAPAAVAAPAVGVATGAATSVATPPARPGGDHLGLLVALCAAAVIGLAVFILRRKPAR